MQKSNYKHLIWFIPWLKSSFFSDSDPLPKYDRWNVSTSTYSDTNQKYTLWQNCLRLFWMFDYTHFGEDSIGKGGLVECETSPASHGDTTSHIVRCSPSVDSRLAQYWRLWKRGIMGVWFRKIQHSLAKWMVVYVHLCNRVQSSPTRPLWHSCIRQGSTHWDTTRGHVISSYCSTETDSITETVGINHLPQMLRAKMRSSP